ncbi:MAG: RsmD family RNA methyltransferase [Flavobacteriales bacterium]|nr:RsmD family RNA methyltransferase [Flavobacteriales bacterium]
MRIVGGKFKARRFEAPKSIKARPTTDMAKEGLFNVLYHKNLLTGVNVLDLFFGIGGISLEFVSRGAESVTSVDVNPISKKHLLSLVKKWEIRNLRVVQADVFKLFKSPKGIFDIVFADPPYAEKKIIEIPDLVMETGWLGNNGTFILEHGHENDFAWHPNFFEHHKFGNVHFSMFR